MARVMTTLPNVPAVRHGRSVGVAVALLTVVSGAFVVGARMFGSIYSESADLAFHYARAYWFTYHWSLPAAHDVGLAGTMSSPTTAHVLAGLVGRIVDSPFRGMHMVAIAAVVLIWCAVAALLTMLPGRRSWVALAALAVVLVLDSSVGPLQLHLHGFEIVVNFFFAQVVGQAVFWWVVWFVVHRRIAGGSYASTAVPIAVTAVLATTFHAVPAVELVALVAGLSAVELADRWRSGRRTVHSVSAPVALSAATALVVAITPGFRAMRTTSEHNGSLDVPYLSGVAGYVALALGVVAVGVGLFALSICRRGEPSSVAVLQGLGLGSCAIALPCIAQAALLADGTGSPYAVKKYVFGLLTVLVVDLCVAVAVLVPGAAVADPPLAASWRLSAIVVLAVVALTAVLSSGTGVRSVSDVTKLERQVIGLVASGERMGAGDYAIGLPGSDRVLDFMFTVAPLNTPLPDAAETVLQGDPSRLERIPGYIVTAAGPGMDRNACRRIGPVEGLVAIDARCWIGTARTCDAAADLGTGGLVVDPRLRGFSQVEPAGRWTVGRRASFSCVLPGRRPEQPLRIAVAATAFLPSRASRQRVTLEAGAAHAQFVFTPRRPRAVLRIAVPPPVGQRVIVRFTLPDAVSPHDAGLSIDARDLGLFVSQIRIE